MYIFYNKKDLIDGAIKIASKEWAEKQPKEKLEKLNQERKQEEKEMLSVFKKEIIDVLKEYVEEVDVFEPNHEPASIYDLVADKIIKDVINIRCYYKNPKDIKNKLK
jgi:hypothetical protein